MPGHLGRSLMIAMIAAGTTIIKVPKTVKPTTAPQPMGRILLPGMTEKKGQDSHTISRFAIKPIAIRRRLRTWR